MVKKVTKKSVERAKSAELLYEVSIDGGNGGAASVSSLDELGEIAEKKLVGEEATQVTLAIKPIMKQGQFAAERADGVVPKTRAHVIGR